jgi:hypothetical protein
MTHAALACTHCREPMRAVVLEGHYGQRVEIDLCARCHLVWIDALESVRLSGLGWIGLLRAMHAAATESAGSNALHLPLGCPRCASPLKPVRNLSRFGRTAAHECPKDHGHFQTFALLLAERGLVRPLTPRDRRTLQAERRATDCLNCGASLDGARGDSCGHCASPLVALDLPRLMGSVMVRHALPLPPDDARPARWACRGCGDAVDPTAMSACERCGHALVAPSLADAMPLLDALEPRLRQMRAPGARPVGERLLRADGYRGTAFYRHIVRPLLPDSPHRVGLYRRWLGPAALMLLWMTLCWFLLR